jgi:DNA polymerase-1
MGRLAKAPDVATVDFETERIESRPVYPPKPVGVALRLPGETRPTYYAWGHATGNNCTEGEARARLRDVWRGDVPILCHNEKFDLDVAETHFDLKLPPWNRSHDTMFLLFLTDPHAPSMALKESAQRVLHIQPTERDALKAWILANVDEARRRPSEWGAYISRAPGDLVGRYAAQGDVNSTLRLFNHLYPQVQARGMGDAYDRERRLLPYLLANERQGLRVDVRALRRDIPLYEAAMLKADAWIRKRLGSKDLNVDSNEDLAKALLKAKVAKPKDFLWTPPSNRFPAGQMSVGKESLDQAVKDIKLVQALGYRSRLSTCLNVFMKPWLRIAEETGGTIHTNWRQVRSSGFGANDNGARTGRLIAAEPNLLNLSKDFEARADGYVHPKWLNVPNLPLVRVYVLPDSGGLFVHRDFNQQELRLLAHYEDGSLCAAYNENPTMDSHAWLHGEIKRVMGLDIKDRTKVKTINFGDIYGLGVPGLVRRLKCSLEEAKTLKQAKKNAMPDVEELKKAIKMAAQSGEPIRTLGGREYYPEEPKLRDGRVQDFIYKLLNYLIQGSAADMTKEAVIRYHEHPKKRGRFMVTVYDEVNSSAPKAAAFDELQVLRETMESIKIDVPLISDPKIGPSWGKVRKLTPAEMKKYREGPFRFDNQGAKQ